MLESALCSFWKREKKRNEGKFENITHHLTVRCFLWERQTTRRFVTYRKLLVCCTVVLKPLHRRHYSETQVSTSMFTFKVNQLVTYSLETYYWGLNLWHYEMSALLKFPCWSTYLFRFNLWIIERHIFMMLWAAINNRYYCVSVTKYK